jgi:transcriptional regulator
LGLTEKERQVLQLRGKGLTQTDVAQRLGISQAAVSDFEKNARKKIIEAQETIEFSRTLLLDQKNAKQNTKENRKTSGVRR